MATASTYLSWEDILIVVLYFVLVFAVGIYVAASLFASNIGSQHFLGLAGSGASAGIGVAAWEFNAILLLQVLGFVFVPVYIACGIYTMPEYMNKRFGGQRIRIYLTMLSLLVYMFTKCSGTLYTGAIFIQQALGWDIYLSIMLQIGIVAILTVTGGLTAVIYTDTLQAVLMVVGAFALMVKALYEIGGFNELWRRYPLAVTNVTVPNTTCHFVNDNWNILLREAKDPNLPWPGFLFGQTPGSLWYWCSDQVIVQRALAAKSLSHAQGATILAAFIKILPLFIIVLPGMISRVLYTDEVACVDPDVCFEVCQSRSGCSNIAYAKLFLGIMPTGAKGIMMAVILAALMSDLDSIFNSASTMFTIDIYERIRSKAGTKELMIVGRLFVLFMVGVSIAWVPIIKENQGGQLYVYMQEVMLYFSPPIAGVYLLAVLWPRCNEKGAFWGLAVGFVTGISRMTLVFLYPGPSGCGQPDRRPAIIKDFHYMYFGLMLFWLTIFISVIVSLATKPPEYKQLYRTTFWTRFHRQTRADVDSGALVAVWGKFATWFTVTRSFVGGVSTPAKSDIIPARSTTAVVISRIQNNKNDDVHDNLAVSSCPAKNGGKEKSHKPSSDRTDDKNPPDHRPQLCVSFKNGDNDSTLTIGKQSQKFCETDQLPSSGKNNPPDGDQEKEKDCMGGNMKEFCYSWICGVSSDAVEQSRLDEANRELKEKMDDELCSIEQDPIAKCALYVLLVIIVGIGVGLYCFFSLWRYTVV